MPASVCYPGPFQEVLGFQVLLSPLPPRLEREQLEDKLSSWLCEAPHCLQGSTYMSLKTDLPETTYKR